MTFEGLSDREAAKRIALGQANVSKNTNKKTIGQIIRSHTLTYFNFLNFFFLISGNL